MKHFSLRYDLYDKDYKHDNVFYKWGRFRRTQKQFIVDKSYSSKTTLGILFDFKHPCLLPCVTVNLESESRSAFFEVFQHGFLKEIERLRRQGIPPLKISHIPVHSSCRNSTPKKVRFVPEVFRTYFRCMISFIIDIHDKGLCTRGFSVKNIVMQNGRIKFFSLKLFHSVDVKDRVADFKALHNIIVDIYKAYPTQDVPKEFQHWIDFLNRPDWYELISFFINFILESVEVLVI